MAGKPDKTPQLGNHSPGPPDFGWRKGPPSHVIADLKQRDAGPRKCRLFCVACCHLVLKDITHPGCLTLLGLAEAFADDPAFGADMGKLRRQVRRWANAIHPSARSEADWNARWSVWCASDPKLVTPGTGFVRRENFRDLLAEVYGPRTKAVSFSPTWRSSTVTALAEGIYHDRAFDRLPILADAIQDAGCEDSAILDHCRGPGPHFRGCWVVDLAAGKS